MKTIYTLLVVLVSTFYGQSMFAQANMVPNYSFEDNVAFCNGFAGSLWDPMIPDWSTIVVNGSTPDLLRPCMISNWQTPANDAGTQTPSHGVSYAGILGTHSYYTFPNGREYMQVPLIMPLVVGIPYRIQYKASLAETSNGATPLGAALGTSPFAFPSLVAYQAINPLPAYSPAGASYSTPTAITDKLGWTTISFDYTPTVSGLQYLLIGNIDNSTTPTSVPGTGLLGSLGPGAYYYIDEVEVFRINDNPASVGDKYKNTLACSAYPNPANDRVQLSFPFQSKYHIEVRNGLGQTMWNQHVENTDNVLIQTQNWSKGIYVVKVVGPDNSMAMMKLLVQH